MKTSILAALTFGLALAPAGFAAADPAAKVKKPARHHHVRMVQQHRIACTKYGCHPIPGNCMPETEYDWWGNPTGYDRVACR